MRLQGVEPALEHLRTEEVRPVGLLVAVAVERRPPLDEAAAAVGDWRDPDVAQ